MSVKKQGTLLLGEGGDAGASGGPITLLVLQQSLDFASVATIVAANQSLAVTGLAVGDIIVAINPAEGVTAGISMTPMGTVLTANTAVIRCTNPTAGAIDLAAFVYTFLVVRPLL